MWHQQSGRLFPLCQPASRLSTGEPASSDSFRSESTFPVPEWTQTQSPLCYHLWDVIGLSVCLLCSMTHPVMKSIGLWFTANTKSAPEATFFFSFLLRRVSATSANVFWDPVSMETSYRHNRPLTSPFITGANRGEWFNMQPLWFNFLPREQNVTQSGSLVISDRYKTQNRRTVSLRGCTLAFCVSAFCSHHVT